MLSESLRSVIPLRGTKENREVLILNVALAFTVLVLCVVQRVSLLKYDTVMCQVFLSC